MKIKANTKAKNTLSKNNKFTVRILSQLGEIVYMGGFDERELACQVAKEEWDSAEYNEFDPEHMQVIDNAQSKFIVNETFQTLN